MREWNLHKGDPLSLIIASDARITPPDYADDQIWELTLGDGEPKALSIQTTYGLRARSMRIFPQFSLNKKTISNPADFFKAPLIKHIYPNFIELEFSPFPHLDVLAEFWVPESKAITCRIRIQNNSPSTVNLQIEWIGILIPTKGERLSAQRLHSTHILSGITGGISPLIFLTNGPKEGSGSYPSMLLDFHITPGKTHKSILVHTALSEKEDSFSLARNIALRNWDAEKVKIEMTNHGRIEVTTGNPNWNTALMLSQNLVERLFFDSSSSTLPHPSFVYNRLPDQGFSILGDGSDYGHQWNGQTTFDVYFICDFLLPAAPELAEGVLLNFLNSQEENGFIDWKQGMAGQKSRLLATPIIATIAWRIFEYTNNISLLEHCFPILLKFLDYWFSSKHDIDKDNIPEWEHILQTGYDDHPIYSQWNENFQGIDIKTSESPALCALLYRECQSIQNMAKVLDNTELIPFLDLKIRNLQNAIEEMWDTNLGIYRDRDRDTHNTTTGELIGHREGSGIIIANKEFDSPIRFFLLIIAEDTTNLKPTIYLHGKSASGNHRVERFKHTNFKWHQGFGRLTGQKLYSTIDQIEVKGLSPRDHIYIHSAGYDCINQTLFLPLWAGIPDINKANQIIKQNLLDPDRFWKKHGIPGCIQTQFDDSNALCSQVNLLWNYFICEGLMTYNHFEVTAKLISKLMKAIIQNLRFENTFRQYYHPEHENGMGERDALTGIVPVGLFLRSLGIQIFSNRKVCIEGINPYPWPVTISYRGLSIIRQKDLTTITFPDGQSVENTDPTPQLITMWENHD